MIAGRTLKSLANGREWIYGELETPSLAELRKGVAASGYKLGKLSLTFVLVRVNSWIVHSGK